MVITEMDEKNKGILNNFRGSIIVSRGHIHQLEKLPGYVAFENEEMKAVISYNISDQECEIVSLDSNYENQGFGTKLIKTVIEKAKANGCKRVWLITSNDNIRAIRFYQKRGFQLKAVHQYAINEARKIKPTIPLIGYEGIPILHEIEIEFLLN